MGRCTISGKRYVYVVKRLFLLLCIAGFTLTVTTAYTQPLENDISITNIIHPGYNNRPDSVFLHSKSLYNQSVKAGDMVGQGQALQQMGDVCFHLGHFAQALEYYLEAVQLFEENKRNDLLATA